METRDCLRRQCKQVRPNRSTGAVSFYQPYGREAQSDAAPPDITLLILRSVTWGAQGGATTLTLTCLTLREPLPQSTCSGTSTWIPV